MGGIWINSPHVCVMFSARIVKKLREIIHVGDSELVGHVSLWRKGRFGDNDFKRCGVCVFIYRLYHL